MADVTITVRPNGAETLRFWGELRTEEIESGWRGAMSFAPASPDVTSQQVVGEAADVAAGEMHYAGQVREYDPTVGSIVLEGPGPPPA